MSRRARDQLLDLLRRAMPISVKRRLRKWHRSLLLHYAVRQVRSTQEPSVQVLRRLVYGWGNEGWSAQPSYLLAIARRVLECDGPILECGSGVSTLLIGLLADRRGVQAWSLEHDVRWVSQTKSMLRRFGVRSVRVVHAPLRSFDGYDWYDHVGRLSAEGFDSVVCDGPPGATRGGRYGLMPQLRKRLRPGCVVLADDADREGEQKIFRAWHDEFGVGWTVSGDDRRYAVLTVPRNAVN